MKLRISVKTWDVDVVRSGVYTLLSAETPVPPYSLVDGYWRLGGISCLCFCRRDGLSRSSRNVVNHLPDYTVSRTRRPYAFPRGLPRVTNCATVIQVSFPPLFFLIRSMKIFKICDSFIPLPEWRHRNWICSFKGSRITSSGAFCSIAPSTSETPQRRGDVPAYMSRIIDPPPTILNWLTAP
jgi:hypothetical protein